MERAGGLKLSKPVQRSPTARFLINTGGLIYGLISLIQVGIRGILFYGFFEQPSQKAKQEIAKAQDKYWNLKRTVDIPGPLVHRFFTDSNGHKIHYVLKGAPEGEKKQHLAIFLHGFPDSWMVWEQALASDRNLNNCTYVAVDLPGFGGSDGLKRYDPNTFMECITEFILGMREEYLPYHDDEVLPTEKSKVIIVAHDWGAAIASRLASEASQLADRFIISNTIHVPLARSNIRGHLDSAGQMLHQWKRSPLSYRLLLKAFQSIAPVLTQTINSAYIFIFNLPAPIANWVGVQGNFYFLRYCNVLATGGSRQPLEHPNSARMLVNSIGPGPDQEHLKAGEGFPNDDMKVPTYPPSVVKRVPNGGWSEKIRLYREGLATKPWTKSLETIAALHALESNPNRRRSSSGAGLFETGPAGALKARTTIVWGCKDPTLDPRINLEGIGDYLPRESQVVVLPETGHWVPCTDEGVRVLDEVIAWSLGGEQGRLKDRLETLKIGAKMTVDRP